MNDLISSVVENAVKEAEKSENSDNTYIGEDGLKRCSVCHEKKQTSIMYDGKLRKFPCICKCEKEREQAELNRIAHQQELDKIRSLKRNSLMDEKFLDCTFESFQVTADNQKNFAIAKRYADKFAELYQKNQGLLFWGNVGTGKTHLACCIGNAVMEKMYSVFATSLVKVLAQVKQNNNKNVETDIIYKMNAAKLLILDDLGAERNTDYALETIYNLVDSRYRSGKPMIVTTNLTLREMQNEQDIRLQRIYDRVLEVCYPMCFAGKSWRMKQAAGRFDEMKSFLEG